MDFAVDCLPPAHAVSALIFRQLFDAASSTYTYLLACTETKEAILIDPVLEQVRAQHSSRGTLAYSARCCSGPLEACNAVGAYYSSSAPYKSCSEQLSTPSTLQYWQPASEQRVHMLALQLAVRVTHDLIQKPTALFTHQETAQQHEICFVLFCSTWCCRWSATCRLLMSWV
jgi:hypothetical protein